MNQLKRIAGAGFGLLTMLCAVILGVATLFGATGCDNGTKKCDCENKIHGNSACNCGGVDCTCEQKEWTLNYEIKLDNQSGTFMGKNGQIALINEVLDELRSANSTEFDNTITSKNPQIIVESNSYPSFVRNDNIINISIIDAFAAKDILKSILTGALIDMISINRFNSTTYLVNGKNVNVKNGWVVYQRGFSEWRGNG
jgi:hypothetical protein